MAPVSNGVSTEEGMTPPTSTGNDSSTQPTETNGDSYFLLEKRNQNGSQSVESTPSPGGGMKNNLEGGKKLSSPQSGSETEEADSDTDGNTNKGYTKRQGKSKLSNVINSSGDEAVVDRNIDGGKAKKTRTQKGKKKASSKFKANNNNNKPSINRPEATPSPPSFLSTVWRSASYTKDSSSKGKSSSTADIENEGGKLTPEEENGGLSGTGSRRLKKARSKSDTGVGGATTVLSDLHYNHANGYSKSVDLRDKQQPASDKEMNGRNLMKSPTTPPTQAVHSDTELQNQGDESQPELYSSPQNNNKQQNKKRFLYNRTNTMGDLFHSNDSPSALFKRRISNFNTVNNPDNNQGSTAAWKDFKNTLRMNFGIKKRRDQNVPQIDYDKSTELVTELLAGAPAAIVFSSSFQRDEKNLKRIPVLLEQIKFQLTDTSESAKVKNRKYRLDLEYGSGPARLTWTIHKEYKDFWMLHNRLKTMPFQGANPFFNKTNLPKFPTKHRYTNRSQQQHNNNYNHSHPTFSNTGSHRPTPSASHPDLGGRRGSMTDTSSSAQNNNNSGNNNSNLMPTTSLFSISSRSTTGSHHTNRFLTPFHSRGEQEVQAELEYKAKVYEFLLKDMERYLKTLFQQFRFRPDANKLFQFLEISNMSIRLAPENSFHGKEGYLFIRSSSTLQGWRVSHWRPNDITQMINRHTHKWFMVRHSYIVCVDNIYETNILEVFLVDSSFKVTQRSITGDVTGGVTDDNDDNRSVQSAPEAHGTGKLKAGSQVHITLQLENNERKIKLVTGSEKNLQLWLDSINEMRDKTPWGNKQRFDSFAPVRKNAHCQWFVDGRDYMWAVSEAISMAKDVIYIHDWWLSPELYLRRPSEGKQEWRLDRLLKRKAEEGVKIFVIVYRNVGQTIPIDSMYTKHSLLDLHENIYVMRSPNQLLQNTFFWAHHEKLCLIDHTIAFIGGIDLCFGRWDTPAHVLNDDSEQAFYAPGTQTFQGTQIWPGKDYSNPRVQDFYSLDQPYESMYDRTKTPRMPWHDVHMMVVGQPARDLVRHFVQRWNYLIRQKRPSRYTPLLLPPADFTDEQVRQLDLDGTCEIQILRSSGLWSLGLQEPEHSIQNAYLKAIEQSEHFVYIENQFFITSTSLENTRVENRIGDALVERIIRAHENGEDWRAVIVIPLMPGFESQVDLPDGSSVRVIMQCQYFSISRGSESIFARLEKEGINPDDYIQFFSLRQWGKIGPNKKLVTEQLYIHAKTMVVDDRVAIIGSANINERSMRGNRDSETAAIVRDAHQVDSFMGGRPYKVGKFAHSLRMRLMREHLGVDIDQLDLVEREAEKLDLMTSPDGTRRYVQGEREPERRRPSYQTTPKQEEFTMPTEAIEMRGFNHFAGIDNIGWRDKKAFSSDSRVQGNTKHRQDVEGYGTDGWKDSAKLHENLKQDRHKKADTEISKVDQYVAEILAEESIEELLKFKRKLYEKLANVSLAWPATEEEGDVSTSLPTNRTHSHSVTSDSSSNESNSHNSEGNNIGVTPKAVDPYCFEDPLSDEYYFDIWFKSAEKNTNIYREIFRCQPDDEVQTWKEYKEYVRYGDKFSEAQDLMSGTKPGTGAEGRAQHAPLGDLDNLSTNDGDADNEDDESEAGGDDDSNERASQQTSSDGINRTNGNSNNGGDSKNRNNSSADSTTQPSQQHTRRRRRANTRSSRRYFSHNHERVPDPEEAERKLKNIKGHLVFFPADWLSREWETGNWFYSLDRIPPVEIYD